MEIYDDAFDRRDHIQSLIDQYEEIMDEIDVIGREAKDKVYSKDVFGRGKSLITDVSRIKWGASSQWSFAPNCACLETMTAGETQLTLLISNYFEVFQNSKMTII